MPRADYEARRAERIERLKGAADSLRGESLRLHSRAHQMASVIPFGQPILIGHHSEGRDRRYRGRIHSTFEKAFETDKKATHYASRAEAAEDNRAISSDDPNAREKLQTKLDALERDQQRMKEANQIIKRKKLTDEQKIAALDDIGIPNAAARELLKPDFAGRIGFADYMLTNNSANIRRIRQRIESLARDEQREAKETTGHGFRIVENTDANRVQIYFDEKPSKEQREVLKSHGFRFAPSEGNAWQRHLNSAGIYAARFVTEKLFPAPAFKIDQAVSTDIFNLSHWNAATAEIVNHQRGVVERISEPGSSNSYSGTDRAYLVRFDSTLPKASTNGSPITHFWFDAKDLEAAK